jgi:hypothetical protein
VISSGPGSLVGMRAAQRLRDVLDSAGYQRSIRWLAIASLLASLTATTYFWMHREVTPRVLRSFNYGEARFARYRSVRREWRPRVGSTLLIRSFHSEDAEVMGRRVCWYFAIFLMLTALVYVASEPRAGPFMALATLAALVYASSPRSENTWMPWDMPALFFAAVALAVARRQRPWLLAAVIVIGMPFKETSLVMAAFFLFFEGKSRRWRLTWAGSTLAVGYALRLAIELLVKNPLGPNAFSTHVGGNPANQARFIENMHFLFSLDGNHIAWANVGTLLIVFLLPAREPILRAIKLVIALLYVGVFTAGSINEFRIFFEALPGATLLLYYALMPPTVGAQPHSPQATG